MPLEDMVGADKFLSAFNTTWPTGDDPKLEGDDHMRGIKNCVVNTFGALDKAVRMSAILQVDIYTTAGSGTWTRPAGCNTIMVWAIGAGGGGGGLSNAAAYKFSAGGAGGGFVIGHYDVSGDASLAYTIGAGGAGGAVPGAGTAGGDTTLAALLTAGGGAGGGWAGPGSASPVSGGSATGGTIANVKGQYGILGRANPTDSGSTFQVVGMQHQPPPPFGAGGIVENLGHAALAGAQPGQGGMGWPGGPTNTTEQNGVAGADGGLIVMSLGAG